MIELKKDWWKIVATCVLTMICTLLVQQVAFKHSDSYQRYKENKDEHAEIVRGILSDIDEAKKDCNLFTNTKYDSILLILKDQQSKIDAIYTYILNHNR